jgi:hypothetical protein
MWGPRGDGHLILVNGDRCEAIDARDAGLPYFGGSSRTCRTGPKLR